MEVSPPLEEAASFRGGAGFGLALLIVALFAVSVVASLQTNEQYVPDSRYYSAMAFRYTGMSQVEAMEATVAMNDAQGWPTPPVEDLFGWGLVQPRVVYPALSAPFVLLIGIPGLLVVPIASMLAVVLVGYRVLLRRYGHTAALAVIVLLLGSHFVFYWGTAMLTEGLAAAIGLGIFLTLPIRDEPKRWHLPLCTALILAMAFTRQAAIIPGAAVVLASMGHTIASKKLWNRWTPFALWSVAAVVGSQIFQSFVWPTFSIREHYLTRVAEVETLRDGILAVPAVLKKIFVADFVQYSARDQAFLILLGLAGVSLVILWKRTEAHLLAGAVSATLLLNVLNGTPTSFRYAMPGLVFYLVGAASVLAVLLHGTDRLSALVAPNADSEH